VAWPCGNLMQLSTMFLACGNYIKTKHTKPFFQSFELEDVGVCMKSSKSRRGQYLGVKVTVQKGLAVMLESVLILVTVCRRPNPQS